MKGYGLYAGAIVLGVIGTAELVFGFSTDAWRASGELTLLCGAIFALVVGIVQTARKR